MSDLLAKNDTSNESVYPGHDADYDPYNPNTWAGQAEVSAEDNPWSIENWTKNHPDELVYSAPEDEDSRESSRRIAIAQEDLGPQAVRMAVGRGVIHLGGDRYTINTINTDTDSQK